MSVLNRAVGTVTRLAARLSGVGIPAEVRYFSRLRNVHTSSGAHPASYSIPTGVLSRGQSGRGVRLFTHLQLVPRLRMSGVKHPLPVYALLVFTRTTLTLELEVRLRCEQYSSYSTVAIVQ